MAKEIGGDLMDRLRVSREKDIFDSIHEERKKMAKNHNIIEIDGEVYAETGAAYLFSDGTTKKDEYGNEFPVKVWLPKSQCEFDSNTFRYGTMQVPEWLALEKGLI